MSLVSEFGPDRLREMGEHDISDELEKGRIVHFPEVPFHLPSEDDLEFLRATVPDVLKKKNASYHAESDKVFGIKADKDTTTRARSVLKGHLETVRDFLTKSTPAFVPGWTVATCSVRPKEEAGRNLGGHKRSDLIHIDAQAYGATHGNRLLRIFVNVNPKTDRIWISKGSFEDVYRRYGQEAGVVPESTSNGYLEERWSDRLYTGIIKGLAKVGPKSVKLLDSSPYDRMMRRLHDWMKETPEFQQEKEGHHEIRFPSYSAWMAFADGVSHACLSGQHALISTFVVPLANCRLPDHAPFHVLRGGVSA